MQDTYDILRKKYYLKSYSILTLFALDDDFWTIYKTYLTLLSLRLEGSKSDKLR